MPPKKRSTAAAAPRPKKVVKRRKKTPAAQPQAPAAQQASKQEKAQARLKTKYIDASGFTSEHTSTISLAENHTTIAGLPGLSDQHHPIHPIFKSRNFANIATQGDYEVLAPSLRLASTILTSDAMKPILKTIMFHTGLEDLNETYKEEELQTYKASDCTLTAVSAGDSRKITQALDKIKDYVTFEPLADPTHEAHTDPDGDLPLVGRPEGFEGTKSRVSYSQSKYEELKAAGEAFTGRRDDIPRVIVLRFYLAVELFHELMHVLQRAKEVPDSANVDAWPFYRNLPPQDQVSEIGFLVEHFIFGGHFALIETGLKRHKTASVNSDLNGLAIMWQWPSTWVVRSYYSSNFALAARAGWEQRFGPKDIAWRVYPDDLQEFFTDEFWEEMPPVTRLPRRLGALFRSDEHGTFEIAPWEQGDPARYGQKRPLNAVDIKIIPRPRH